MDSVTPIPVAIFGKDPKVARSVCEKLLPDFDAVHVCLDLPTALIELPALFSSSFSPSSTPPAPASGLGTNAFTLDPAKRRAKVPRAVFFGGKFTDDEYNAIVDAVQKATTAAAAAAAADGGNVDGFDQQSARGGGSGIGGGDGGESSNSRDGGTGNNGGSSSTAHEQQQRRRHQSQQRPTQVHFIKVQKRDVLAAGSLGPNPDVICKVFRKKMAAALDKAEREQPCS
ncbi:hypothetical protein P885DRAFT_79554 [Corynascus similis CBS 632.67]